MNTGRYPTFRRSSGAGGIFGDPRAKLQSGLDCVLDGIGVRTDI
ncbi:MULTISPECIES: hypothetical protein [unclassified Streptomyces]